MDEPDHNLLFAQDSPVPWVLYSFLSYEVANLRAAFLTPVHSMAVGIAAVFLAPSVLLHASLQQFFLQ